MHQHTTMRFYSDAHEEPVLTKCSECGEPLDVSVALLEEQYGDKPLESTVELNNCPTRGAVDNDHTCPECKGVLRDVHTGEMGS